MTAYLSDEIKAGLADARVAMLRKSSRLCVHDGDKVYRVLRLWDGGFSLGEEDMPALRGHVDLYDGPRHLYQCLIVASTEEGVEQIYDFKWNTAVSDGPARDYERRAPETVALIPRML